MLSAAGTRRGRALVDLVGILYLSLSSAGGAAELPCLGQHLVRMLVGGGIHVEAVDDGELRALRRQAGPVAGGLVQTHGLRDL